jgi:hypothetical protein
MKKTKVFFSIVILLLAASTFVSAEEEALRNSPTERKPWEKFSLNLALYVTEMNTELRFGAKGLGFDIDAEEILNLDSNPLTYRIDAHWRFSDNRKHRLDIRYVSFRREGRRSVLRDIEIEGPGGNTIYIPAGTYVESNADLDIYQASYSYSFFQDDRVDLAAIAGLYIMPIDIGLHAKGLVNQESTDKFIAPLPLFGLRADFAITPKVFLRSRTQIFYVRLDDFKGFLTENHFAIEYLHTKYFGMGIGYDMFRLRIESDGEDYPYIDLKGNVDFEYGAVMLYGKIYL